jgi:hypothetical protein
LYVRIRRPLVAADQMGPNLPNQKGFFIFKEIKNVETKVVTNNNKKNREPKKKSIFVRNDKEKGSVSHFSGGYHISNLSLTILMLQHQTFILMIILVLVWKGNVNGGDCLHDPNGFNYSCYVDSRSKLAAYTNPSDQGAYWRCSVRKPNGNSCGVMLLEKDGVFTTISSIGHQHGNAIRKIKCHNCSPQQNNLFASFYN